MDRRVQKTKNAINDAYLDLLMSSNSSRITISEIARRADIDRKTFYLHYSSVDDIAEEFIERHVQEFKCTLDHIISDNTSRMINMDVFVEQFKKTILENLPLYRCIAKNDRFQEFWRRLENVLSDTIVAEYAPHVAVSESSLNIYCRFYFHGILAIYADWLRGDITGSFEEISLAAADISYLALEKFNTHLIRK